MLIWQGRYGSDERLVLDADSAAVLDSNRVPNVLSEFRSLHCIKGSIKTFQSFFESRSLTSTCCRDWTLADLHACCVVFYY